jgi:diguanylate cyclase (GGDEF)-like protein
VRSTAEIPAGLLRARRTAAGARASLAICGLLLSLTDPHGLKSLIGFGLILVTALVQLLAARTDWLRVEESIAPVAAVLIIGLGNEQVTAVSLLWLAAVASGVLARGGRIHWIGRGVLLSALALPIVRLQHLTPGYAALCVGAIALLLTCGRVTSELRSLLELARYDANHDELTGTLSRPAFRAQLDEIAAAGHEHPEMMLMLIDLDNFGAINKSAGHAAGDTTLRSVVARIRSAIGDQGVIGRLGGDEFAAVVSAPEPEALARRLLTDLGREDAGIKAVQASIGIASIQRDGDDAESLLRAVDVALRVAKRTGGHKPSVYAGESFSDLGPGGAREAIERLIDGEGLTMAVQPIVAMPSGTPHAYEALARFHTGGTSSPLHWFALADEFGVRDRLELACLRVALEMLDARPEGTLLSVNLSGSLLLDPRTEGLLSAQRSLDGLILELTENSLLENTAGTHAEISRLLAAGVRFAVDDMGAGYSGLRQITTVRPTYLKLDRSLISGIDTDPDRGALVSAMLGYARQTGGHLVAEGVETEAELETLTQLGVELVQGFYLARPGWPWPAVRVLAPNRPALEPLRSPARTNEAGLPAAQRLA